MNDKCANCTATEDECADASTRCCAQCTHRGPVEVKLQDFNQYANVFNTAKQAMTFVAAHRPGHIVVKVGRKFVPATPEFAKRMGLKIITN